MKARLPQTCLHRGAGTPTWMCIFTMAFPIKVAPKKVQKGTRKWPQVIPARSNRGLGIYRHRRCVSQQQHPHLSAVCDGTHRSTSQDAKEAHFLHQVLDSQFGSGGKILHG